MTTGAAAVPVVRAGASARTTGVPAHPRGATHRTVGTLVHELPPSAVMALACLAGDAAALCAAAVALALLACGYGRMARSSAFAREHVVDLWAMLLVLVGMAFSGGEVAGGPAVAPTVASPHRHLAASIAGPVGPALIVVAVAGWTVGRLLLARRVRRLHTAVSAVVCGGMLVAMIAM